MLKKKLYEVWFSDGNPEHRHMLTVAAINKHDAYMVAREKLEREVVIKGSPYSFIKELKD